MKETNRITIIEKVSQKAIKQKKAAVLLDITVRQIRRLVRVYRKDGAAGLAHKLRGMPSNHQCDKEALARAVETVRDRYGDFSVTLAHEKLTSLHGFSYSRETLRKEMTAQGLWKPGKHPVPVIHQMRERRCSLGELVQADGSPHDWFEGRSAACTLLVFIDDATGKLLHLEFAPSETTQAYFSAARSYILRHGKPMALYVDRHGVFRVNTTRANSAGISDSNGKTQFGRAMDELGIELICANSPQAKGRVEKVNQTLQDRLVKEMRLAGISSMEEGNVFVLDYMEAYNRQFAVVPKNQADLHRMLGPAENLDDILVEKHTRILSRGLTLSYKHRIYQIVTDRPTYAMRHAPVVVQDDGHQTITIRYKGQQLAYRILEVHPKSKIVDTKHVNIVVDRVKERTAYIPVIHPWKTPYLYW